MDAVDLCVPNHLHHPMTVAAAQAGKHVYCEKPLTGYFGRGEAAEQVSKTPREVMLRETLADADEMLAACAASGVQLCYGEDWVYAPVLEKARRLIQVSNSPIMELRGEESHNGSHADYAKRWATSGGGALLRLGCASDWRRLAAQALGRSAATGSAHSRGCGHGRGRDPHGHRRCPA